VIRTSRDLSAAIKADLVRPILHASRYYITREGIVYSSMAEIVRQMTPSEKKGYLVLYLSGDHRKVVCKLIHRAVLESWTRCANAGEEARHLDGNRLNNSLSNLAWGTSKENAKDRDMHGTTARGERVGNARLTEADVSRMRDLHRCQIGARKIARYLAINLATTKDVLKRRTWRHV